MITFSSLGKFGATGNQMFQYAALLGIARKTGHLVKIPTPPAPKTKQGVAARLIREVVFFESLFSATKWTWLFGWLFHFALLLAAFRHLRYFTDPVWGWVSWEIVQAAGHYGGYVMVFGLLGLLARRVFVDRVRYISSPSDYLMLILIIGIVCIHKSNNHTIDLLQTILCVIDSCEGNISLSHRDKTDHRLVKTSS